MSPAEPEKTIDDERYLFIEWETNDVYRRIGGVLEKYDPVEQRWFVEGDGTGDPWRIDGGRVEVLGLEPMGLEWLR